MDNLFNVFGDKNKQRKPKDIGKELEDFAKEIKDDQDDPDRYAAEMLLLMRRSQEVRRTLCEGALDGEFTEEKLIEICRYFEKELSEIEKFAEKINGDG